MGQGAILFSPARGHGVVIAIAALSVSVVLLSVGLFVQNQIRTLAAELPDAAIRFERQIGYGGLIHHFKNYVLRPDETVYRDAALQSAAEALATLDEIELILHDIGLPEDGSAIRDTITLYLDRIAIIDDLHAEGADARAIDHAVRISDEDALSKLIEAKEAASFVISERLRRLTALGIVAGMIFAASAAALIHAFLQTRRARLRVEALRSEAIETTITLEKTEQARREAEAAIEELRAFSYAMSHDLKAPANTLTVLVNELFYSMKPTRDQRDIMDMCLKTLERMKTLIGDLLGYAGLIHDIPQEDWVSVDSVIADVRHDLSADIGARNASVTVDPMPQVLANKSHLHMLFQNLIMNAVTYGKDGVPPEIHITGRTLSNERWYEIAISDNGIGISTVNQRRIFELFKRLHRQDERPGNGLGLTICRRVVLNLGGKITVKSAEDRGSTFILSLPIDRIRFS